MQNLNVGGLQLIDNATDDEDTIKVKNDAVGYQAAPADTIDLRVLNLAFDFDFDILDVTNVTMDDLILIGDRHFTYASTTEVDPPANALTISRLGTGSLTVDINPIADRDWYRVDLVEGTTYSFSTSDALGEDPVLALFDTDGVTLLATDDDSGPGLEALLTFTATETGTYFLEASEFGNNEAITYTLSAETNRDVADDGGDDESVVVGNLDLIDDVQLFDAIIFTDASITSAGNEFVADLVAGELLDGDGDVLFTIDGSADTFDFSRVTSAVTVAAIGGGVTLLGGSAGDTITGSGGADFIAGNGGNDVLSGGIGQELVSFQLDGILDAAVNATIRFDGTVSDIDLLEGTAFLAGAGSVAVGNAIATALGGSAAALLATNAAFDADPTTNITSVSFDGTSVTFAFEAGVNVPTAVVLTELGADAGSFQIATADTTNGSDGGNDRFVFEATAALNGSDTINGFAVGDVLDFTAFATDDAPQAELADTSRAT